jgi:hypothetical protein
MASCGYEFLFFSPCIAGATSCCVSDVLVFFTGADVVPPMGFEKKPKVTFLPEDATLCTASTCDLQLRLPTRYRTYKSFRAAILMSIIDNNGFGGL